MWAKFERGGNPLRKNTCFTIFQIVKTWSIKLEKKWIQNDEDQEDKTNTSTPKTGCK